MTSFSAAVLVASLLSLASLLGYTFWLMRSGRLSAHLTVRWLLAEGAAILAVILWSWLPVFSFTSGLNDRELLVILAVVSFVFIVFLMLDSLARISAHTHHIKRLTQEVALLRAAMAGPEVAAVPCAIEAGAGCGDLPNRSRRRPRTWPRTLAYIWIFACVAVFMLEMQSGNLLFLKPYLTAAYLH